MLYKLCTQIQAASPSVWEQWDTVDFSSWSHQLKQISYFQTIHFHFGFKLHGQAELKVTCWSKEALKFCKGAKQKKTFHHFFSYLQKKEFWKVKMLLILWNDWLSRAIKILKDYCIEKDISTALCSASIRNSPLLNNFK